MPRSRYESPIHNRGGGRRRASRSRPDLGRPARRRAVRPKRARRRGRTRHQSRAAFAVGYAACFHSGLLSVARGRKLDASDSTVTAQVGIGPTGRGGFGLAVSLDLHGPNLSRVDAEDLMRRAHALCPYSNATRGNVDVALRVDGRVLEETALTTNKEGNGHEQYKTSSAAEAEAINQSGISDGR